MQLSNSHKMQCILVACHSLLDPENTLSLRETILLLEHTPAAAKQARIRATSHTSGLQNTAQRCSTTEVNDSVLPTWGQLKALLLLNPASSPEWFCCLKSRLKTFGNRDHVFPSPGSNISGNENLKDAGLELC